MALCSKDIQSSRITGDSGGAGKGLARKLSDATKDPRSFHPMFHLSRCCGFVSLEPHGHRTATTAVGTMSKFKLQEQNWGGGGSYIGGVFSLCPLPITTKEDLTRTSGLISQK